MMMMTQKSVIISDHETDNPSGQRLASVALQTLF